MRNWPLVVAMAFSAGTYLIVPDSVAERYGLFEISCTLVFGLALVACWIRGQAPTPDRMAWRVQSVALLCYLLADLYAAFVPNIGSPSVADALWLLFYSLTYVAIALFIRARLIRFHPSTWLDGAIAGMGAASLVAAIWLGQVITLTGGSWPVIAVNLAYPTADLLLIVILLTVGHALGARDRSWVLLALGLGSFFLADVVYLYQVAGGHWTRGAPVQLFWPIGVVLIGLAANSRSTSAKVESSRAHEYLIPALFVTVAVVVLVYGQRTHLPISSAILAVLTLFLGAIRMTVTLREVRELATTKQEARTDYVTRLPNRRALGEYLSRSLRNHQQPTSLVVIDLDRFKEINDSLGHSAGDRLLRLVGRRLSETTPVGTSMARLGGDEFAVVLPATPASQGLEIATELLAGLAAPFNIDGIDLHVAASMGVATFPDHADTESGLMSCADIAMYQAKREKSGVTTFKIEIDNPSRARLELMSDLRAAFENDQFVLHFQPQLNLRTGRVMGLEALVRWQHPKHGLIYPDEFIKLLTQSGLMFEATSLIMDKALACWAQLDRRGHDLQMSVNISASDLSNPALTPTVAALMKKYDIGPGTLLLEVTEDALMSDSLSAGMVIGAIRSLGVRISMDDYGTGQASLAHLRDFPLDEIKLDRGFLNDAPYDVRNAAIIRSVIALGHDLHLTTVAEGVETQAALEWLETLGCDIAQGYQISPPLPLPALLSWLTSPDRAENARHRASRAIGMPAGSAVRHMATR